MPQTEEKTSSQPATPAQDPGFESRHQKELGVGKFAGTVAFNNFFPLLTGAAGGVLGYFGLAKPATKVLPKKFVRGVGALEAVKDETWHTIKSILNSGSSALTSGNEDARKQEAIEELQKTFKTSADDAKKIAKIVLEGKGSKNEKLIEIAEALGREIPKVPNSIKLGTMGVLGFIGLMAGSITVGYREWRKKESARLAAEEINRDIAGIELFKPSNPELVEENKRLRTMVAALPTIDPATAESQGRVENRQMQAALS